MVKTVAIITARGGSKRIPGKNIKEVIDCYHEQGEEFELACNIYPTAPFITAKRLKEAYEEISGSAADLS